MNPRLSLYVCQAYEPEVSMVLKSGNFPDVMLKSFPFWCMYGPIGHDFMEKILAEGAKDDETVLVIAGPCQGPGISHISNNPKIRLHLMDHCMELVCNKDTLFHFIKKRYYLITNGWLKSFRQQINAWGFEAEAAKQFFRESADTILLLDTSLSEDYLTDLHELSGYMGLPFEILPNGLTHTRMLVENLVFQWRAGHEQIRLNNHIATISRQSADNAMIFKEMQFLVNLTEEEEIIGKVFDLFNLLFMPQQISYEPSGENNIPGRVSFRETNPETEPASGIFIVEARCQGELNGIFHIRGLAFPEYLNQYKQLSEVLGGMIGLAIANARKYAIIRQNEDQLRENARAMEVLNENKDKFFSILSHDLKGPFNALLGFSALMSKDLNQFSLSDIQNMMKRIHTSAENLFKLLENLLEWSRIQRGMIDFEPVICKIPDIIDQITALLALQAEKKEIRFFDRIPPGTEVLADYHMLTTVIRNLVSNAVKFSRRGGFVYIMVEKDDEEVFELSVRDEGIGISQELKERLFVMGAGKNRPGTDNEPSTGLGLLLCKEYIDKHQGDIWVVSDQEEGSSFHIKIPKTRAVQTL